VPLVGALSTMKKRVLASKGNVPDANWKLPEFRLLTPSLAVRPLATTLGSVEELPSELLGWDVLQLLAVAPERTVKVPSVVVSPLKLALPVMFSGVPGVKEPVNVASVTGRGTPLTRVRKKKLPIATRWQAFIKKGILPQVPIRREEQFGAVLKRRLLHNTERRVPEDSGSRLSRRNQSVRPT
jgi:hypothetical protein